MANLPAKITTIIMSGKYVRCQGVLRTLRLLETGWDSCPWGEVGADPGKLTPWSLFSHSPVLCIHGSSPLQRNVDGKFGFS